MKTILVIAMLGLSACTYANTYSEQPTKALDRNSEYSVVDNPQGIYDHGPVCPLSDDP